MNADAAMLATFTDKVHERLRESVATAGRLKAVTTSATGIIPRNDRYHPEGDEMYILGVLEATIDRGERAFIETGRALATIRLYHLYMACGAKTFGDYLHDRWGMDRSRAYQYIDAFVMSTVVDGIPNERVARELAPLKHDPDAIREVWRCVGEHPTSELVRAKVATYLGQQRRQVAAGTRPPRKMTPEEFAQQFSEAEALVMSLAMVRKEGQTFDALARRILVVVRRLSWWASSLSGWEVDLTITGDDEAYRDGAEGAA